MSTSAEETTIERTEGPSAEPSSTWWKRPLLLLILAAGVGVMVAWILFLGWVVWKLASIVLP